MPSRLDTQHLQLPESNNYAHPTKTNHLPNHWVLLGTMVSNIFHNDLTPWIRPSNSLCGKSILATALIWTTGTDSKPLNSIACSDAGKDILLSILGRTSTACTRTLASYLTQLCKHRTLPTRTLTLALPATTTEPVRCLNMTKETTRSSTSSPYFLNAVTSTTLYLPSSVFSMMNLHWKPSKVTWMTGFSPFQTNQLSQQDTDPRLQTQYCIKRNMPYRSGNFLIEYQTLYNIDLLIDFCPLVIP